MSLFQTIFSNVWTIVLAIFLLGFTIFVHELGHFLAAKKRGMKIERFSIGFGPKIMGWTGKDGIEYRLSWIPLGGYVALPQLADMQAIEGGAKADIEKLPPAGYLDKVIVAVAGPLFNVIFALLLGTIIWITGQQVPAGVQSNVIGTARTTVENSAGQSVPGPAVAAGLKAGDSILAVDGKSVSTFEDIYERIVLGAGRTATGEPKVLLTIKRGDAVSEVEVHPAYVSNDKIRDIGITIAAKVMIEKPLPNSPAESAGLQAGDVLTQIDGNAIQGIRTIIDSLAVTKDKPVTITYIRDGKSGTVQVAPRLDPEKSIYMIGIAPSIEYVTVYITPWDQVANVLARTWRTLSSLLNPKTDVDLGKMSGPIGIVNVIANAVRYDFGTVITLMVLINISLAFLNLLPIPVLDGGHILLATIAKIKGSPLPVRVVMTLQSVCMVLLLSLMVYVCFSDVRRMIRDSFGSKPASAQQAPAPVASGTAATVSGTVK